MKTMFAIAFIENVNRFFAACANLNIRNIRLHDRKDGMTEFNFDTNEDTNKIVGMMRKNSMISICYTLER